MPRKQKKYNFTYKTTCLKTNKYYYGMHSTDVLDDDYLGSGQKLWHSINRHGKENHKREILEFFDNRKDLIEAEKALITEDMINDKNCMNMALGGEGGIGWSKTAQIKGGKATGKANRKSGTRKHLLWLKTDSIYHAKFCAALSRNRADFSGRNNGMYNKKHSNNSKAKMSMAKMGKNNPSYNTHWITNEIDSKKIKFNDQIPEGWRLGRKIKKKT